MYKTYIRISLLRLNIALRPNGALPGAAHRRLQLLLHVAAQLQLAHASASATLLLLAVCVVLVVRGFSSSGLQVSLIPDIPTKFYPKFSEDDIF